jgi:hypothetical protein
MTDKPARFCCSSRLATSTLRSTHHAKVKFCRSAKSDPDDSPVKYSGDLSFEANTQNWVFQKTAIDSVVSEFPSISE